MFAQDPLINFPTPNGIGFGLTRGPAFCLFSKKIIIDYSGKLLNFSARLMDLARPKGIVIDANYLPEIIPDEFRSRFKKQNVYLRGISEDKPLSVLNSSEVTIPEYALHPLKLFHWEKVTKDIQVKALLRLSGRLTYKLPKKPLSDDKISVGFYYPNPNVKGFTITAPCTDIKYEERADGPAVGIGLDSSKKIASTLKPSKKVSFIIEYVPQSRIPRSK